MKNKATKLLLDLGMPPELAGYLYAREAILITIDTPNSAYRWCDTYDKVAEKFSTTGKRVERSIRHVLKKTQENGTIEYVEMFYGNITKPPIVSRFLATVAEHVKMQEDYHVEIQK